MSYLCSNFKLIKSFMNILIIGATSGIGRGLWDTYAENDNNVIVLGRRISLLDEMKEMRPTNTTIYSCDITNHQELEPLFKDVFDNAKHIDLAIICAGTGDLNPELLPDIELSTINTNVLGWTIAVDSIYNLFKKQGFGHIVTITSIGGLVGEPNAPAYSATKAYQINYSQALRKKSKKDGISVTEVRPGLVNTAMAKGEGLFWVMPVPKVVRQIKKAITQKKSLVVVTKRWNIISFIMKYFMS